jgi:hypothetical protein
MFAETDFGRQVAIGIATSRSEWGSRVDGRSDRDGLDYNCHALERCSDLLVWVRRETGLRWIEESAERWVDHWIFLLSLEL